MRGAGDWHRRVEYWCTWLEEGARRRLVGDPTIQTFFCPYCHLALMRLTPAYVLQI